MMRPLFLVIPALVIAGCAATKMTMTEMFQQPPRALESDPRATGLVILEFSIASPGGLPHIVHGAHIQGTWPNAPDLYAPRFQWRSEPMGVLFQGVAAGRYRVTKVLAFDYSYDANTRKQQPTIRAWALSDTSLSFEVRVGALSYVGPFDAIPHGHQVRATSRADPASERTAWRALARKYPSSPWDSIIHRRVAEIGGSRQLTPGSRATFTGIVRTDHLGSFSQRAGPIGFGDTLIVSSEGLDYRGKKHLMIPVAELRALRRSNYWVMVEYEHDGKTRQVYFGYGFVNSSRITDDIENAIDSLLKQEE